MDRKFYIADTHFSHENVIQFDSRPFTTIEEHDRVLIERWNSVIKSKNDHVHVLGDFMRKKIWKVPVVWEMFGNVEVEAESLEEAIKMVQRDEDAEGNPFSLPTEDYYIEDSFRVEFTNDELEDLNYE